MRIRALTAGALTAALAVTLTGTQAAADDDPLTEFHTQEVVWAPCEEPELISPAPGVEWDLACAEIEVPLDHSDPAGETTTVAISRSAASGERQGVLLTNPGGPGGPGRAMAGGLGEGDLRLGEAYDVIGMDPRGTPSSGSPADCDGAVPPQAHMNFLPADEEFSELTRATIAYQRACEQADDGVREHLTTAETARDMDVIRAALGEETLHYYGGSYGTYLGAVYGSLFPERTGRTVLDAPVDPDGMWFDVFVQQAPAFNVNVERLAEWIAEHDDVLGMGASQEEVLDAFDGTLERLRENPREDIPGLPEGMEYDHNLFAMDAGQLAANQSQWDLAAWSLRPIVLDEPIGAALDEALRSEEPEPDYSYYDLLNAVVCEAPWPDRLSERYADMREIREEHPYGVGALWHTPQPCAFSSSEPEEPLVDLERDGYPTGLVLASEYDAQTPYPNGSTMAERLDNTLITVTDEGRHGTFGLPCVTELVEDYLVDGALPDGDVECAGVPAPESPIAEPSGDELAELFSETWRDQSDPLPRELLN